MISHIYNINEYRFISKFQFISQKVVDKNNRYKTQVKDT